MLRNACMPQNGFFIEVFQEKSWYYVGLFFRRPLGPLPPWETLLIRIYAIIRKRQNNANAICYFLFKTWILLSLPSLSANNLSSLGKKLDVQPQFVCGFKHVQHVCFAWAKHVQHVFCCAAFFMELNMCNKHVFNMFFVESNMCNILFLHIIHSTNTLLLHMNIYKEEENKFNMKKSPCR